MATINLQIIAVSSLSMFAIIGGALFIFFRAETKKLHHATRSLLRTDRAPTKFSLIFPETRALWRSILTLQSNVRSLESMGQTETEALELSSSISAASHDFSCACEEAVAAVMRQISPEIVACAILFRSENNHQLTVISSRGIPALRIEEPLATYIDSLSTNYKESDWGFVEPDDTHQLDFSTFAISIQLLLPLRSSNQIRGALWIGLKKGAAGLNSKRVERLKAFSLHTAGSLEAALLANAKLNSREEKFNSIVGMSHDMRAPGNTAIYALHGLLHGENRNLTSEQIEGLNIVKDGIEDQLGLIDDILDFARSESNQLRAKIAAHPLKPLLQRLINNCTPLAKAKGLETHASDIPEIAAVCDEQHFKRIISNLLSNAIKYTDRGSITIEIKHSASRLYIAISDTGIGIPIDDEDKIFTEFYRAANGSRQQGIGLGLALAKRLAKLNDAKISYRSRKGGGSIFTVSFRALSLSELRPASEKTFSSPIETILVVEDDPAVSRATLRQIDGLAENLIAAASFHEAKEITSVISPTVIISDFNLGDGTALNLIHELQQRKLHIPAIILTGLSYSLDVDNLISHGTPISILQKPVSRTELREKVREIASLFNSSDPSNHYSC